MLPLAGTVRWPHWHARNARRRRQDRTGDRHSRDRAPDTARRLREPARDHRHAGTLPATPGTQLLARRTGADSPPTLRPPVLNRSAHGKSRPTRQRFAARSGTSRAALAPMAAPSHIAWRRSVVRSDADEARRDRTPDADEARPPALERRPSRSQGTARRAALSECASPEPQVPDQEALTDACGGRSAQGQKGPK